jgi:hypothetical protein
MRFPDAVRFFVEVRLAGGNIIRVAAAGKPDC